MASGQGLKDSMSIVNLRSLALKGGIQEGLFQSTIISSPIFLSRLQRDEHAKAVDFSMQARVQMDDHGTSVFDPSGEARGAASSSQPAVTQQFHGDFALSQSSTSRLHAQNSFL